LIYRLDATVGDAVDLGSFPQGHRRIVPLTGGTFSGPELSGQLVTGASADWQTVLADGTAFSAIRYTLRTNDGNLLYIESRGVRHGPADVLARLGPRRGCGSQRVHIPDHDPDRDRRPQA
jgi:hypothetical protein